MTPGGERLPRRYNERYDFTEALPPLASVRHVHLIAIGGAGMSGIARLFLARGVTVTGSDARESETVDALRRAGARVAIGHDPGNVEGADTVVVSSAIRDDNPELVAARATGARVLHRAQGLAVATEGRTVAAVAGANGKTTTSAMLTVALQSAGEDPSFAIGAELVGQGVNAAPGRGPAFVVEADESDSSFLVYRPTVAVVTNVRPDHLDFYGDFATVQQAYRDFVGTIRPGGLLVACADDPGSAELAEAAAADGVRVLTYGFDEGADVRLIDPATQGLGTTATLVDTGREQHVSPDPVIEGEAFPTLRLGVPGRHNQLNAAAVYAAAVHGLGADAGAVLAGLTSFAGASRRFEHRGEVGGVTVVDDYAHNPDKVAAVVGTAAGLVAGTGRLLVVFQPHLYSRTQHFAREFGVGLSPADTVLVMDVYGAREDPVEGVTGALVAEAVDGDARFVPDGDEVPRQVADIARPGDLVLTVGAGDVTTLGPRILDELRRRAGAAR